MSAIALLHAALATPYDYGMLKFDNTTLDRVVGHGTPAFVRIDKEYSYGDEDDASFTFKVKHRGNGYLLLYFGTGTNDFRKMYKKSYSDLNLQERQRLATVAYRLPRTVDAEGTVIRGTWSRSSYLKSGSPRYLFIVYSNYDMDCNAVCQYSQYVEGEGPASRS